MLIVMVDVHVLESGIEAFKAASAANAVNSLQEPGIARFDVIQRADDPTRFVLIEVYRDEQAPLAHKQTAHYEAWRDAVSPLMASARSSRKFVNLFPSEAGWEMPEAR